MRDHPRAAARKALGAVLPTLDGPGRELAAATRAPLSVPRLELRQAPRGVRAALIGGVRQATLPRHRRQMRRREKCPCRQRAALRTGLRRVAFHHRPHVRERAALVAEIVIDRHSTISLLAPCFPLPPVMEAAAATSTCDRTNHLSGASGIGVPPFTCEIG